jgi:hypothetical protein
LWSLSRLLSLGETAVDELESEALTQASQVCPGAPEPVVVLGKMSFFDKNLSEPEHCVWFLPQPGNGVPKWHRTRQPQER